MSPRLAVSLFAISLVAPAGAETTGGLDAHVHGEAELAAVLDGDTLTLEFESPLWSFVGFEHAPKTEAQKTAMEELDRWFETTPALSPSPAADCALTSKSVSLGEDGAHSDHDGQDGHDHHDHHKHHGDHAEHDDHDDHAEAGHSDHDHHDDEHDHEAHAGEGSTHRSLSARYVFTCSAPDQLNALRAGGLFKTYGNLQKINAVFLSDDIQTGATLSQRITTFRFD